MMRCLSTRSSGKIESTLLEAGGCHKTLLRVQTEVTPGGEDAHCTVGALCRLTLTVRREDETEDQEDEREDEREDEEAQEKGQRFLYDIVSDAHTWAVCGQSSGVFSLSGDKYTSHIDVMPQSAGLLTYPLVNISRYLANTDVSSSPPPSPSSPCPATVAPLCGGEVYQASLAAQVKVMPPALAAPYGIEVAAAE